MLNRFILTTQNTGGIQHTNFMKPNLDNHPLSEHKPPPNIEIKRRMWFPDALVPPQPTCHIILHPPPFFQVRDNAQSVPCHIIKILGHIHVKRLVIPPSSIPPKQSQPMYLHFKRTIFMNHVTKAL
jgi:hypothetical protein